MERQNLLGIFLKFKAPRVICSKTLNKFWSETVQYISCAFLYVCQNITDILIIQHCILSFKTSLYHHITDIRKISHSDKYFFSSKANRMKKTINIKKVQTGLLAECYKLKKNIY